MSTPTNDNRRYFRIIDNIGLHYRKIDEEEYGSLKFASRHADVPSLDALSDINQQLQLVVEKLKIKYTDVAQLATLLNRKIDLVLENSNIGEGLAKLERIPQVQVDFSACGLAFPAKAALDPGQLLELDLALHGGKQHLKLLGKVVKTEPGIGELEVGVEGYTHLVRIEFIDTSEQVQEFLIQYVVKRQGILLKARRDSDSHSLDRRK